MGYEHLFAEHDLALLYDWLHETGELYLDLDRPHSGGTNTSVHFIHNLAELRAIVARETWPEVSISIFRVKQYPIRGIAGAELLTAATEQIPDLQCFTILSASTDPLAACNAVGWGNSHRELRTEFTRLLGQPIWVGQDPFDLPPLDHETRFLNSPDQVFIVKCRKDQPRVVKNHFSYGPFESSPDWYRSRIGCW